MRSRGRWIEHFTISDGIQVTCVTHVAMASPLSMLCAVAVEHGDQFLSNRKRSLQVDDSCHGQEDLHQQSTHRCFDLLSGAVQEELGTLLGREGEELQ